MGSKLRIAKSSLPLPVVAGGTGLSDLASLRAAMAIESTGTVVMFAGSSAPAGWLLCDGSSCIRASYPDLYAIIGTTYGPGNNPGSTFNVPDFKGRSPIGTGTGVGGGSSGTGLPSSGSSLPNPGTTAAWARGDWYGEEVHTITAAESGVAQHLHANTAAATATGSHSHTFSSASAGINNNHYHYIWCCANVTGPWGAIGGTFIALQVNHNTGQPLNSGGGADAHTHSISGTSGNETTAHNHTITITPVAPTTAPAVSSHNNIQPLMGMNFIIKT